MAHRTGKDRSQFGLFATPLEELIAEDNLVRVIDVFVDKLDLAQLGFEHVRPKQTGAPPYEPALLLKIYRVHDKIGAACFHATFLSVVFCSVCILKAINSSMSPFVFTALKSIIF